MKNKIKIIRVANIPGALSDILRGQLNYLNSLENFEVIAVSNPSETLEDLKIQEKIRVYGVPITRSINPFDDFKSIYKLYKFLKIEKPAIIHSHTPKAGLVSMIAGFISGVPIRIHTFTGLIFPTQKNIILKYILILFDRLICLLATDIYPEGLGVKNDLIKYRITKKKLKVLVNGNINGISTNYYSSEKFNPSFISNFKNKYGILESDLVFLFVGRILKDKGINELIEAFLKIFKKHSNIKLLIVGNFESDINPISVKSKFEILNNTNIIFVGFQNDVRPFYAISNVFVFPSHREGFPNVVLQAGSMGLPCIVTDINGSNEIIINGINGLICNKNDIDSLFVCIEKMILDSDLRIKLSLNSRKYIMDRYNQKKVWDATLNEYKIALTKINYINHYNEN